MRINWSVKLIEHITVNNDPKDEVIFLSTELVNVKISTLMTNIVLL